jgi:hypothetical protein
MLTLAHQPRDEDPGTPFTFDGVGFDENVINQNLGLNAIEK